MLDLVLPVFVLIGVGYVLRHLDILNEDASHRLVGLIMNVTFPATLYLGLVKAPIPEGAWKLPIFALAAAAASWTLTYAYARMARLDGPATGSLMVAASFGNSGFLGVPFCYWVYGDVGRVSAVIYDLIGVSIPLYGIGFVILEAFGGRKLEWTAFTNFLKTPVLWTAVAGGLTRALMPWWEANVGAQWLAGKVFMQSLELLAPLTAPLAMLALGVNLRVKAVLEFLPTVTLACLAKIVLMPATVYALVHFFGPAGVPGKTAVLEAAMPGGLVAGVLCGRYGCNARLGAAITVGTTLAALLTLPFWTGLMGR